MTIPKSLLAGLSAGALIVMVATFLLDNVYLTDGAQESLQGQEQEVAAIVSSTSESQGQTSAGGPVYKRPDGTHENLPDQGDADLLIDKIVQLAGTEESPVFTRYADAVGALDRETVPVLREMLKDPACKNRWRSISNMLAWLSDSKDEGSMNALVAYIRRPDFWNDADRSDGHGYINVYGKAAAVGLLGFFELESASRILRRAFTQEGAEELVGTWVNMPHAVKDYSAADTIESVRMQAAVGLALSRNPENIALVEAQVEELAHWTWSREYAESELVEDVMESSVDGGIPYHSLADAMTRLDRINDVGLEEFLRHDDTEDGFGVKVPYMDKYFGQTLPNGRTVLDPCPVCGMTRKLDTRDGS